MKMLMSFLISFTLSAQENSISPIIHLTEQLECDRETAFAMFTKNDQLTQWLALEADIEPVVGGKYECFWDPANKNINSTIGCKVLAVDSNRFIQFEWKGPVQVSEFMNNADPLTVVTVIFNPEGSGIRVDLIHTGWRKTAEWDKARQLFIKSWSMSLKRLAAKLHNIRENEKHGSIDYHDIEKKLTSAKSYFLLIFKAGPKRGTFEQKVSDDIQQKHLQYLFQLRANGKLYLQGPVLDQNSTLRGIGIFAAATKNEVESLLEKDPWVTAGGLVYEVYPWMGLPGDRLP